MDYQRLPDLKPGTGRGNRSSAWRAALTLLGPALTAHAVASALTAYAATVPALTALAATLAFAVAWRYGPRHASTNAGYASHAISNLYDSFLVAAGTLAGAWAISAVIGDAHAFYCSEAVPWRIEIALFGSFALGLLTRMAEARGLQRLGYPLTLLALFWIAPYYGYFSGPVFLGIGLISGCADRSVVQFCVAAFGMAAGTAIGRSVAGWLSSSSSS
ncbi:hypothetical protein EGT07_23920 [Herbaspirillum sp. HC18]|nr:hypothetical protein EGT07_23920 [Herbaspirillum sp. HC18]